MKMHAEPKRALHEPNPIKNFYPECVYLGLFWDTDKGFKNDTVDLLFEVNFGEETIHLRIGSFKIGIIEGELRLNITNGSAPLAYRNFWQELPKTVTVKRLIGETQKRVLSDKTTIANNLGVKMAVPYAGAKAGLEKSRATEEGRNTTDELEYVLFQISTKGSPEMPVWEFVAKSGEYVLSGGRTGRLTTVLLANRPCIIDARFEVSDLCIYISDVEGLIPSNITATKRSVVKALLLKWARKKIGRTISAGQIKYG